MRSAHTRSGSLGDGGLLAPHRQQRRRAGGAFGGLSRREAVLLAIVLVLGGFVLLSSFFGASDANLPATGSAGLSASQRLNKPAHHRRLGQAGQEQDSNGAEQGAHDGAITAEQESSHRTAREAWQEPDLQSGDTATQVGAVHARSAAVDASALSGDARGVDAVYMGEADSTRSADNHVTTGGNGGDTADAADTATISATSSVTVAADDADAADADAGDGSGGAARVSNSSDSSSGQDSQQGAGGVADSAESQAQSADNSGSGNTTPSAQARTSPNTANATDEGGTGAGDSNNSDTGSRTDAAQDGSQQSNGSSSDGDSNAVGADGGASQGQSGGNEEGGDNEQEEDEETAKRRRWWESLPEEERARLRAEAEAAAKRAMQEKWDRDRPFVLDVLAHGLVSERDGAGAGDGRPALKLYPVRQVNDPSMTEWEFRYGTDWAVVPTLVKQSQADWFRPEAFSADTMRELIGGYSVFQPRPECAEGGSQRDTAHCHHVREPAATPAVHEAPQWQASNTSALGISTYADLLRVQAEEAEQGRFLHAREVPLGSVPGLAPRVRVPKYFPNNYNDLSSAPNASLAATLLAADTPALSINAAGSGTPLHAEPQMLRRWETQLQGRRLVRLVPPSEQRRLQPSAADADVVYSVDVMQPDFAAQPQLAGMLVYEALLAPGDVLLVPSGWARQTLNLEWSVVLSSAYLDQHIQDLYLEWHDQHDADDAALQQLRRTVEAFFLPMRSAVNRTDNPTLQEFFSWHALELAPVSIAAREFVAALEKLELSPDMWRDRSSRPLLYAAVQWNYVSLVEWLLDKGCSLAGAMGPELLSIAEEAGFTKLAVLLREKLQGGEQAHL